MWKRIARDAGAVVILVAAIGYAASLTHPIYTAKVPVVGNVIRAVEPPAQPLSVAGPALTGGALADSIAAIEKSPELAVQKQKFAADVVRTRRMSQGRADAVARFAVAEACLLGTHPAVSLEGMLTENVRVLAR